MADQRIYPNRTASMMPGGSGEPLSVPVRKLDDCLDDWGLACVDLLKVDVDGYESKIIEGAAQAIRVGRIRNLIIEFNRHWLSQSGESPESMRAKLELLGFHDVSARWWLRSLLLGPTDDRHFEWLARF
jgi:hypothetical protein